jgi:hypothetical protein
LRDEVGVDAVRVVRRVTVLFDDQERRNVPVMEGPDLEMLYPFSMG